MFISNIMPTISSAMLGVKKIENDGVTEGEGRVLQQGLENVSVVI